MASLSNINGLFDVHSTGAILFSTSHGTSGQILKSNGNAAPTWVDASTVIGGPYLPLSGGTLTGATATASGISFTVGGVLNGTSATFSGSISATSTLNTLNLYNNANNDAFRVFRGSLQTLGLWTATNGTILSLSSDTVAGSITLDSRANQDSYINTGGNVGIGTASPLNRTHIVGPTLTTGTETTYGLAVSDVGDETKTLILGYDLVNDVGIIEAIDQQTAWKNLAFAISGNTKVGIGTTSPEQKLHVEGASITVNRGNDDSSIAFQNSTSNATWRIGRDYSNGEALTFAYSATDYPSLTGNGLIYIKTPGDVGIGTASPAW